MSAMYIFRKFLLDQSGAISVDWVTLTGGITGLAMAAGGIVFSSIDRTTTDIHDAAMSHVDERIKSVLTVPEDVSATPLEMADKSKLTSLELLKLGTQDGLWFPDEYVVFYDSLQPEKKDSPVWPSPAQFETIYSNGYPISEATIGAFAAAL